MSNASKLPVRIALDLRPTATDPPPNEARVLGFWADSDRESHEPSDASWCVCDYLGGCWVPVGGEPAGCAAPSHWAPVDEMTAAVEAAEPALAGLPARTLVAEAADACEEAGLVAYAEMLRAPSAGVAELDEVRLACRALLGCALPGAAKRAALVKADRAALAALDQMRRG